MSLAIFNLQVALILPSKFQVNWFFVHDKKFKMDFQDATVAVILDFQYKQI